MGDRLGTPSAVGFLFFGNFLFRFDGFWAILKKRKRWHSKLHPKTGFLPLSVCKYSDNKVGFMQEMHPRFNVMLSAN